MKKRCLVLFLSRPFPVLCHAQTEETPTITIPRVSRAPKLSDFLNGTPREAETRVTDFRQMDPGDGDPVSQPTTAFLSYDAKNLYVAFIAKDDPKLIRARVAKRKQILTDDRITINIDTFHDHRHAYWFDVNPYAVQFDGITTDGYGDDFSWEGLWYTEAKITEDGYVVLITIPFKTLRFSNAPKQQWGVLLGRFIQRNNEFAHVAACHPPETAAVRRAVRRHGWPGRHLARQEHAVHPLRAVFGIALSGPRGRRATGDGLQTGFPRRH